MDRTPVTSSVIAGIGYDAVTSTLEVEFCSGRVYRYFRVPPAVVDALRRANSVGGYFNRVVKPRYRGREVHAGHDGLVSRRK